MKAWICVPLIALALAGCAGQPPVSQLPAPVAVTSDPQQCDSRVECTSKTSRTLLFVFDYAAAGAPLVQRDGRWLFTPADTPGSDWPALYLRLAEAEHLVRAAEQAGAAALHDDLAGEGEERGLSHRDSASPRRPRAAP